MKTYLASLLVIGFGLATAALIPARRAQTDPPFKDKPLSYWTRVLIEHPVEHRKTLLEIGPAIVPHLVQEIKRYEPYRRNVYHQCYAALHARVPWQIKAYLPKPIFKQARALNAIKLLSELGPASKDAVPALIPLLSDENVSSAVVVTLGAIGPAAKDAVPKLIQLLDDSHAWVATTLGKIGPNAKDAIPALARALTNEVKMIRREAREALQQIDPTQFAAYARP